MEGKPNRLIKESSPYLLQHAHNIVDWYPWGEEAFETARRENKPVFLSIGYSTCHWCHVMERESFENQAVGEMLNECFVSVKVDREERPDIDQLYMSYSIAMNGSGGWPLSLFMTPDKKPFLVATYIPPESSGQRKGLLELSVEIKELWNNERARIDSSSEDMLSHMKSMARVETSDFHGQPFIPANQLFQKTYDVEHGGFGDNQKFHCPHNLLYLIGQYRTRQDKSLLDMATNTLRAIRLSGTYDHVGFGFHRYSTDPAWHLPHFEKMLYDQAMLLIAYAEAWHATKDEFFLTVAKETISFVQTEMYSPEQGFFSAYDADSEGHEGKFYIFSIDELKELLDADELDFVVEKFGFTADGNFLDEATGKNNGSNLFTLGGLPNNDQFDFDDHCQKWESIRRKIYTHREKRVKPLLDDKVILEWNGMMIAALAKASFLLNDQEASVLAEQGLSTVRQKLINKNGELYRSTREGKISGSAFLGDYAWYVFALIEMYQSTLNHEYLAEALTRQQEAVTLFFDADSGKFSVNRRGANELVMDIYDEYDGAHPSPASVNFHNLLRLDNFFHSSELKEVTEKAARAIAKTIESYPIGHSQWLMALEQYFQGGRQLLITSTTNSLEFKQVQEVIQRVNPPRVACVWKNEMNSEKIGLMFPWTAAMPVNESKVTIYLCQDYQCGLPIHSADELETALQQLMKGNTE